MPKQIFDLYDFLGPLVAALVFAILVLLISFFLLNFICVTKDDDLTCFERFGYRHNLRLGPHSLDHVRHNRPSYCSYSASATAQGDRTKKAHRLLSFRQTPSPPSIIRHHPIPELKVDEASN